MKLEDEAKKLQATKGGIGKLGLVATTRNERVKRALEKGASGSPVS